MIFKTKVLLLLTLLTIIEKWFNLLQLIQTNSEKLGKTYSITQQSTSATEGH